MTDKNLKQEEVALSVKGSRVHSSASIHQLPQANATVLAPAAHPGFTVSPEVVHPSHSHLSYRMIQSSFQHYPPLPPLPVSLSGPKPNQITNDLGPPIFMPPLNLGVPKSSVCSSKQQQQQAVAAAGSLAVVSSVPPSSTPSSSSHIDGTSSPTTILSSYPDMTTPSATPFHAASVMLHQPQQSYQTMNATKTTQQPLLKSTQSSSSSSTIHKISPHEQQELQRKSSPSPHYHPNNSKPSGAGSSYGSNRGGSTSTVQTNAINMIKQPPTGAGVTKTMPGMVELSTAGYISTSGHQYQPIPPPSANKSGVMKPMKDDKNRTDSVESSVVVSSSGLGGSGLLCMEGLPPPVPRNVSSMTGTDVKQDRPSHPSNHIPDTHPNTMQHQPQGSESQIPWPEAVSKNIIIPAPNLTGKDIANLTSASSSPIATNDRTGNDITWLPLSDHHHQPTPQSINHHPAPLSTISSSSECSSSSNTSNSLLSYINMVSHDSGHPHTGSNTSTGMGMSLGTQNTISSPRPSILRKRGFDGRSSVDSLNSPSSPVMHKILRQRSRGSPSDQGENHFLKDDISSPRKRPRKQLLHIDSTNDHHFLPQDGDPSPLTTVESHNPMVSNSMMANERLLGPLPLKDKSSHKASEEEPCSSQLEKQLDKSSNILYISQIRKSPYPIVQLCRRTHRTARNHFRRHADIKYKEEESISPHEMCGQGSTWLRSSGWKLQHLSSQLDKMESYESDVIKVLEQLQGKCEDVMKTMSDEELEEKHRKFLRETIMGNIERIKRSKLHTQETKESMMKILNVNGKVVELMKKFAVRLPTKHLVATTSILDELESNPP